MVAIPQAGDRLEAGPEVDAPRWRAVRRDPAAGMGTTVVLTLPGEGRVMESFEDGHRPGLVHCVAVQAVQEMDRDPRTVVIAVMASGALSNAVRETAALKTAVLKVAALKPVAKLTVAMAIAAGATGVLKVAALKPVAMVISASRDIVLMTGVSRTVVREDAVSVTGTPELSLPGGPNAMIVRPQTSPEEKLLPMGLIPWLMICSGAVMPPRRRSRPVVRSIASGAPVRCAVLQSSCSCFVMPSPPEFWWRRSPGLVWLR